MLNLSSPGSSRRAMLCPPIKLSAHFQLLFQHCWYEPDIFSILKRTVGEAPTEMILILGRSRFQNGSVWLESSLTLYPFSNIHADVYKEGKHRCPWVWRNISWFLCKLQSDISHRTCLKVLLYSSVFLWVFVTATSFEACIYELFYIHISVSQCWMLICTDMVGQCIVEVFILKATSY